MPEEKKTLQELLDEYQQMQSAQQMGNSQMSQQPDDAPMALGTAPMSMPGDEVPTTPPAPPAPVPPTPEPDEDESGEEQEVPADENAVMAKIAAAPDDSDEDDSDDDEDEEAAAPKETPHPPLESARNPPLPLPAQQPQQTQQNSDSDLMNRLLAAQQEQKRQQALAMIQRGGAQMLGGATHRTPDYTNAEAIEKQAGQPVEDIKQQVAMQEVQSKLNDQKEMQDPNSVTSGMLRDFAKKIGIPVGDNVSGAHIQAAAPFLVKAFAAEESNQKARDIAALNNASKEKIAEQNIAGRAGIAGSRAAAQAGTADIQGQDKTFKNLQQDKAYQTYSNQVRNADGLKNLVTDATTNPASANALAVYAARYTTPGRLNKQEIDALSGQSKDFINKIKQVASTGSTGTLTPENANFMRQFIDITSNDARKQKAAIEQNYVGQYSRSHNKDIGQAQQQILGQSAPGQQSDEDKIQKAMQNNPKASREDVIKVLKKKGYIK